MFTVLFGGLCGQERGVGGNAAEHHGAELKLGAAARPDRWYRSSRR